MNGFSKRCVAISFALIGIVDLSRAEDSSVDFVSPTPVVPAAEWPAYRRDPGLTGFSPLVGGVATAPHPRWTYDLGGVNTHTERPHLADVNGDDRDELLRVPADRIICQNVPGDRLWETGPLAHPQIVQIRDFAGDGTRGILVAACNGVEHHSYIVSGVTGNATLLYTYGNAFGRYERFGRILPDVPGEQLCAWWSGDTAKRFGGNAQRGVGYLWSFENGVDAPRQRFHVEEEGTIYAPLHLFADMDGDGRTDMVMISHEAMWVYDLASGKRLAHSSWGPQIRTYWAATAAISLADDELPSLLMINPMIPGVQVVTQNGTTSQSRWKRVVGDEEDQYQTKVRIDRGAPDPFIDLDDDGEIEILAAVTNEHSDEKMHLVIFGADKGERIYDQADQTVLTIDDLDGAAPPEVLLREGTDTLRICNWNGRTFIDRRRATLVTPLLKPALPEGSLTRAVGARSSGINMPLWRERPNSDLFLLQFADDLWSCRLTADTFEQVQKIATHEASQAVSPPDDYAWDGSQVTVTENDVSRITYTVPQRQTYSSGPPIVGKLGDGMWIVAREHSDALVSLPEMVRTDRFWSKIHCRPTESA